MWGASYPRHTYVVLRNKINLILLRVSRPEVNLEDGCESAGLRNKCSSLECFFFYTWPGCAYKQQQTGSLTPEMRPESYNFQCGYHNGTDVLSVGQMYSVWDRCTRCGTDVPSMGQMYSVWNRCTQCGTDVLGVGQMYSVWDRCTQCGTDVLSVVQMYSVWDRCTQCETDVLSVKQMYSVWDRCTQCKTDVLSVEQMYSVWNAVPLILVLAMKERENRTKGGI
jgi:DNA-directed RNA polymerase subunit RPC12/RpoP